MNFTKSKRENIMFIKMIVLVCVIAKNKNEFDKMEHYADIIQECQDDLGLKVSSFPEIGKST
jgi:hypothetical protein